MKIFLNGEVVSKNDATLSAFDHGYLYGLGVFETIRIYDGHPFLLDDHLARLHEGLNELNIKWSYHKEDVKRALNSLLITNGLKDAYVRINVSAGIGEIGLETSPYTEPTTIIYMKPIPLFPSHKRATILKRRRNSPEGDYRLKSHHYLNNILAKRELGVNSNKEGIFLNQNDFVAEGIVSNLFWIRDGKVYTPSIETGILNGITRQFIITLLNNKGIRVREGEFSQDDLLGASEVFVTNSIQEIIPITFIDEHPFQGLEGELTEMLVNSYADYRYSLWSRHEL